MSDDVWQRDEIESPCVKVCVIHAQTGLCLGCARSLDEIGRWSSMMPGECRAVMATLPDRRPHPGRRRGGAAARQATRGDI